MSNNGSTIYKLKYFSFINKSIIVSTLSVLFLFILAPGAYLLLVYGENVHIFLKLLWLALLLLVIATLIITPFNGLYITKKGTILFLPDFRFCVFCLEKLKAIAITFQEWENGRYSAVVKIVYKDGKVFVKDYSKQFKNLRTKGHIVFAYTINPTQLEKMIKKMAHMSQLESVITVVNYAGMITYQKRETLDTGDSSVY